MIVVFCAFGAELAPLRTRLDDQTRLALGSLRGYQGRMAQCEVSLVVSGVGIRRARAAAAFALDNLSKVEKVFLTGVAGALRDDLKIGDVVVGDRLMLRREQTFAIEHQLDVPGEHLDATTAGLHANKIKYIRGPMLTSRRVIATAAEKRRAHSALGAITVDMESAVMAHEAALRRVPFVAIRTIMDTAAQDLEGALLTDEEGRIRVTHAAKALIRNPRMIVASIHLLRNLRIAAHKMATTLEAVLTSAE